MPLHVWRRVISAAAWRAANSTTSMLTVSSSSSTSSSSSSGASQAKGKSLSTYGKSPATALVPPALSSASASSDTTSSNRSGTDGRYGGAALKAGIGDKSRSSDTAVAPTAAAAVGYIADDDSGGSDDDSGCSDDDSCNVSEQRLRRPGQHRRSHSATKVSKLPEQANKLPPVHPHRDKAARFAAKT
eukprot:603-Heterococcus_DN1.PRE.1